ncbi:MacB family efflux pump subunit [Desulfovibrio legallii]|uniref:Pyoverdine export ATP-binding/permease protein PvdT n=1 Tax=Desulfovibrio legallii TaxID=571438 RepID=A0A1G7Q2Q1_9BACT|nr:MacB family efflux pump subunit [Desulfovibrio legallii]SDF91890.1 macrolide transport system ATP-binding/permease protein [Desulfovibrio legallii]
MPLIAVERVSKWYGVEPNRVQVLHEVSFTIERGEFVAIMGPSGSGKSTLMNLLGCLDTPGAGVCRINGQDTAALDADALSDLRCAYLGFVFQRYNLLSSCSAVENVALPAVYAGTGKAVRLARAAALLRSLGLEDRLRSLPVELSGGQQQRVSIARALMNGGEIILADEPTGALDSVSGKQVMDTLEALNRKGHTVIVVTHDPTVAARAARVIRISDGRLAADERTRPAADAAALPQAAAAPAWGRLERLREAARMSVQAIWAHKLRSCLTMLGIIIGIAAVVCVMALGRGSQEKIVADISAMGTNTIDIFPGKDFGDRHAAKVTTLTAADAAVLARQTYLASSTPNASASGTLTWRNISVTAQLNGVGASYFDVKGLELASGRFFDAADVRANASCVVIDDNTRKKLFPLGDAAGQVVLFNKRPLRVVGVVKKKDMGFGPSDTLNLWAPYTTVMYRVSGTHSISSITVKVADAVPPLLAEQNIVRLLTARHGSKDFFTFNTDTIKKTVESATGTMTLLVTGIALIALVVGGIGVMNIMLVSVTERTREIGLRMAVGARRGHIMEQFLMEAIFICLAGSLAGILLATAVSGLADMLAVAFPLRIAADSIVLSVVCSSLIGTVFGFVPARNAARLNPIEALARE